MGSSKQFVKAHFEDADNLSMEIIVQYVVNVSISQAVLTIAKFLTFFDKLLKELGVLTNCYLTYGHFH